jgi:hypothetical protein
VAKKKKKAVKKKVAKRTAKASRARKAPARKAKAVRRAQPARKVAKPAAKAKAKLTASAAKANAERRRLENEERALVRDSENENEETQMRDNPEYIEDAVTDPLGEEMGEAAVESELSGDQEVENIRDEDLDDEEGGPFVTTSGNQEFAKGSDGSNPADAEPAAFPTANAQPRGR